MWPGAFVNAGFRQACLAEIASGVGSDWRSDPDLPGYSARRETMINILADAMAEHVDLDVLLAGTRVAGRL